MATYVELFALRNDAALVNRITVAVAVKAQAISAEALPSATAVAWAKEALADPRGKATQIVNFVLAANKSQASSAILSAADSAIQSNVDSAVDDLLSQ